jgi:hypothetical protein
VKLKTISHFRETGGLLTRHGSVHLHSNYFRGLISLSNIVFTLTLAWQISGCYLETWLLISSLMNTELRTYLLWYVTFVKRGTKLYFQDMALYAFTCAVWKPSIESDVYLGFTPYLTSRIVSWSLPAICHRILQSQSRYICTQPLLLTQNRNTPKTPKKKT